MADLTEHWNSETPLPIHRAINWFNRWVKLNSEGRRYKISEEATIIIRERLDVIIKRFDVKAEQPQGLSDALNGILLRYNGLIYEENGIIMEVDLYDREALHENSESYFFGLGDTPIFNKYLFDYYPEILI